MKYVIRLEKYDYFGGASTTEYKSYTNLLEFWKEFKQLRETDYNYSDAYQSTHYYTVHKEDTEVPPQRPHARSYEEWEAYKESQKRKNEEIVSNEVDFEEEKIDLFGDIDSDEEDDDLFRYI